MYIRTGYAIAYDTVCATPMNLLLSVHPSRTGDIVTPEVIRFDPPVPFAQHLDAFGNVCTRIVAPAGRISMSADFTIRDSGLPDDVAPDAAQHPVQDLPNEVLIYLFGSRYCDTDKLTDIAWSLFAKTPEGWPLAQAIISFVHNHIVFNYLEADATRSAFEGYTQRRGVCRDYAHLAIAFFRCMNIPARYCMGYLGDIGVPLVLPMDFSAWCEVYLGGRWYALDPRNNKARIGRILMARGRDATDCALTTSFGAHVLARFDIHTDEVQADATAAQASLPAAA